MLSTAIGALIGGAIDGADGDDSTADGALIGGAVGYLVSALVPVVVTLRRRLGGPQGIGHGQGRGLWKGK